MIVLFFRVLLFGVFFPKKSNAFHKLCTVEIVDEVNFNGLKHFLGTCGWIPGGAYDVVLPSCMKQLMEGNIHHTRQCLMWGFNKPKPCERLFDLSEKMFS